MGWLGLIFEYAAKGSLPTARDDSQATFTATFSDSADPYVDLSPGIIKFTIVLLLPLPRLRVPLTFFRLLLSERRYGVSDTPKPTNKVVAENVVEHLVCFRVPTNLRRPELAYLDYGGANHLSQSHHETQIYDRDTAFNGERFLTPWKRACSNNYPGGLILRPVFLSFCNPVVLPCGDVLTLVDDSPQFLSAGQYSMNNVCPSGATPDALNVIPWKSTPQRGVCIGLAHFAELFAGLAFQLEGEIVDSRFQRCSFRRMLSTLPCRALLEKSNLFLRLLGNFFRGLIGRLA